MIARPVFSCAVELTLGGKQGKALWRPDRQTFAAVAGTEVVGQRYGELLTLAALEQQLYHRSLRTNALGVAALAQLGVNVGRLHGASYLVGTKLPNETMVIVTPDSHLLPMKGQWRWGPDSDNTETATAIIQAAFAPGVDLPNIDRIASAFAAGTLHAIEGDWAVDLIHVAHFDRTGQPARIELDNPAMRAVARSRVSPQRSQSARGQQANEHLRSHR